MPLSLRDRGKHRLDHPDAAIPVSSHLHVHPGWMFVTLQITFNPDEAEPDSGFRGLVLSAKKLVIHRLVAEERARHSIARRILAETARLWKGNLPYRSNAYPGYARITGERDLKST